MKRIASIVSIVCLIALCFSLFVACAGNEKKVDEYVEKVNTENDFYYVATAVDGDVTASTEVIISVNKIQVLNIVTTKSVDANGKEVFDTKRTENYYEVDGKNVKDYFKADCPTGKHKDKDGNILKEWQYDEITTATNYLDDAREMLRTQLALFDLKSENLVWDKEAKGFVYADDKTPASAALYSDVVITAKSGTLSINAKLGDAEVSYSYMNFGSARASLPEVCKDLTKKK